MVHTSWLDFWARIAIMLPAFLISVSFHECSHAWVASLLGDDTAKRKGRLTLNPLAHLDFLGLLFLLIFRIGWANPVPMDYRNFKRPRLYAVITAFAGPLANFILAYLCFMIMAHFPATFFSSAASITFLQILTATAYVNIMLGVFNLLPIPPLDGGHLLISLLVKDFPNVVIWLYRYSLLILIGIFLLPQFHIALTKLIMYAEIIIKSLVF